MASEPLDSVALLKAAEDNATASADASRRDGSLLVKKAHETSSNLSEDASGEAQAVRQRILEESRAEAAKESDAILATAKTEADRVIACAVDERIVSECLEEFLGDCVV
jgi:vacuolar-type H+-ATPase subunit H